MPEIKVSPEDEDLLGYTWTLAGRPVRKYLRGWVGGKPQYIHRIVLSRMLGRKLSRHEQVDHINTDTFDNRRENLRVATQSQNLGNQNPYNGRRYKGVNPSGNGWYAECAGEIIRGFETEEEAAAAYNEMALAHFGEYARLNDID